jgi:hypothetical protein
MSVLSFHFQPSPMFVGKARDLLKAPGLPKIIRLGWKGMPGTNTPAYYKHLYITDIISFITLAQDVIKSFTSVIYSFS